jgi:hypothetical protein
MYFVHDPLGKTLHHTRDVLFRNRMQYKALNAADGAIFNKHIYEDVIEEPKHTEK